MEKKELLIAALFTLSSSALADTYCSYTVYRVGADPSKSGAIHSVEDSLNLRTVADKGSLKVNQTLEDCFKKASELLETHRELDGKNKNEFPKIEVTFKSDTETVQIKIKQKNKNKKAAQEEPAKTEEVKAN